MQQESCDLI